MHDNQDHKADSELDKPKKTKTLAELVEGSDTLDSGQELGIEALEDCTLEYALEHIVPKDKKLIEIFIKFDECERLFNENPSDKAFQKFFEDMIDRIEAGEFTKMQGVAIYQRLFKAKELFVEKKQELITENTANIDRHRNINKYIKSSFLKED